MIFDTLENLPKYVDSIPGLEEVIRCLKEENLASKPVFVCDKQRTLPLQYYRIRNDRKSALRKTPLRHGRAGYA